jgi:hypothetical protein
MREKHLVDFWTKMLRASTTGSGGKRKVRDGDQSPPFKARRIDAGKGI